MVGDIAWGSLKWASLDEAARSEAQLSAMAGEEIRVWPPFVLRVLRSALPKAGRVAERQTSERADVLRGLLYLTYMVRLYGQSRAIPPPAAADGDNHHPLARKLGIEPMDAWRELLVRFTAPQGGSSADDLSVTRRLTSESKHKLAMHALALALWIGHGQGDTAELAKLLSLTPKEANLYLRQLGCAMPRTRGSTACSLKLPLELPRVEQGRAAPKKR